MGIRKFTIDERGTRTWPNGAVGYRPDRRMNCGIDLLGPYAKVERCPVAPVDETDPHRGRKVTAYAQGYADTYFSVPAAASIDGKIRKGYLTLGEDGIVFVPYHRTER